MDVYLHGARALGERADDRDVQTNRQERVRHVVEDGGHEALHDLQVASMLRVEPLLLSARHVRGAVQSGVSRPSHLEHALDRARARCARLFGRRARDHRRSALLHVQAVDQAAEHAQASLAHLLISVIL